VERDWKKEKNTTILIFRLFSEKTLDKKLNYVSSSRYVADLVAVFVGVFLTLFFAYNAA
jgi:hypothetical protein